LPASASRTLRGRVTSLSKRQREGKLNHGDSSEVSNEQA
jgi:hypothetical protein